jgi:alkanesulfonate monooxygenase SsuD/methylene tetrahydromethanopterin reductase-like flavin-dependent oxidoreductase (luciferase family)
MEFGIQFFPSVGPDTVEARRYFDDALRLVEAGDRLGFTHTRIVEHYFHYYGGYSPNPLLFLTAASQRSKNMRLITGAVLPAFNHPLKLAGEIGMLDAISGGRLEVGFARAFLPHEFGRFGVSLDESRARFDEGMEIVRRLLEEEEVAYEGRFHRFGPTTSLPRPTQRPRPPFWVAALATDESFENAGRLGHSMMAIPLVGSEMARLIAIYRKAWRDAGHPGNGRMMLAFHMLCHPDDATAQTIARDPVNRYLKAIIDAAVDWTEGKTSKDYRNYDKLFSKLAEQTFDTTLAQGGAWVGSPATIVRQIRDYAETVGGFEVASLQVNFNDLPYATALASMELFAHEVMPQVALTSV